MLSESKKTVLGTSNQEVSVSVDKNMGLLESCHAWKCVPADIFGSADILF